MDSLRKQVDKNLRKENKYIFNSKAEQFWEFVKNDKNWWLTVITVLLLFFCLQFINIPFLRFVPINSETIKSLIENRTTNIVTLISVTFAIIGFLIANLSIKESYTYNLLFKKSGFFPIAYIALTVIASFIILSTCKDWLQIMRQGDILLVGTYMILLIIFLIGVLFTQLIKFTNAKELRKLIQKELIREAKNNLLIIAR